MKGLAADFGTMPLQDIVLYLGNRQLTGTLSVEQGTAKVAVAVRGGNAFNAASNEPREYLGQFLINFGYITEEQLTKAFQVQAETKILLGRIMVITGAVDEETLRQVVSIKIRETLAEAFRWTEGGFRFARDVLPPTRDAVEVNVPLLDVHREGEFRETAWASMRQVFPAGNLTLKLDESRVPRSVAPGSTDARLFQAVREGQSINEMLLTLHATDFQLYQRLYALYRQGVVQPGAPATERSERVGDAPSGEDLVAKAKELLDAGRVSEAEMLAARAVDVNPDREAKGLLERAQETLTQLLREEYLARRRVPNLAIEPARLRSMDLTPPEKYLLSRIDGVRDIKAIVRVSPVRELDALKAFKRFAESGLVRID